MTNHSQHDPKWEKLEIISLKSRMLQGCPLFPFLHNIELEEVTGEINEKDTNRERRNQNIPACNILHIGDHYGNKCE